MEFEELRESGGRDADGEAFHLDVVVAERAARLFLESGIANVKMTQIAEAVGVGVATLYRHYETKAAVAVLAGTLMWRRLGERAGALVGSGAYLALSGLGRVRRLLEEYVNAYIANPSFVRFVAELDALVLSEGAPEQALATYGEQVDSFFAPFEGAYLLGLQDGTIVREEDPRVLYNTLAHALMGLAVKAVQGDVIPSDDVSGGERELRCMVGLACEALGREA